MVHANTTMAFHLNGGKKPRFSERVNHRRYLSAYALRRGEKVMPGVIRALLNHCWQEANKRKDDREMDLIEQAGDRWEPNHYVPF